MKIVIPVTQHDVAKLESTVRAFTKFGGLVEHAIIFIYNGSCVNPVTNAVERLRPMAREVEAVPTTYEIANGRAFADVNQLFAYAVRVLANKGNVEPFLWYELDCRPLKPGWANAIANEYNIRGARLMGNVVDIPYIRNGFLETTTGDKMMMGVGVYPPNLTQNEETKPIIDDLSKPLPQNPEAPFDVYGRSNFRKLGMANTNLICDMWNTFNYTKDERGIKCEPMPIDRLVRNRGGYINSEAVLVHGVKDGSLDAIIFDESPSQAGRTPIISTTSQVATSGANDVGMFNPSSTGVGASAAPSFSEKVSAILKEGNIQLGGLATKMGIEKKSLMGQLMTAGFRVVGPGQWVKEPLSSSNASET